MDDPPAAGHAPRIDRLGDAALIVTLSDELDLRANAWARRAAAELAVRRAAVPGLGAAVPGHASVLVSFDPERCGEAALRSLLATVLDATGRRETATGRRETAADGVLHEIVVGYGGTDGPDLADVAARTGLSEDQVVALHSGVEYRVLVLGFLPGFPYLGVVPAPLDLPRRATPRLRVPAGSIAIAGRQTGIYPFESPGGWHLIGRTHAPLWDVQRDHPALLSPGDRVRFVPS